RMTGGGFGGSAIALVPERAVADVQAAVVAACRQRGLITPATLAVTSGPAARRLS
ncbi:MAG: galK, partial [Modestobacter sp.]|nr:galK [Modestobacter sp.]